MIEIATEFQKDRIEMWARVDSEFKELSRTFNACLQAYPETLNITQMLDATYQTLEGEEIIRTTFNINPHFLFGVWRIRKSLENDVLSGGDYSKPKVKEVA